MFRHFEVSRGAGQPQEQVFYTKCALGKQETESALTQSSWLKREFESEMCTTVKVPHRQDTRERHETLCITGSREVNSITEGEVKGVEIATLCNAVHH